MYVLAIFVNVINESSCTLLYNFNKFPIFVFHFNISDENFLIVGGSGVEIDTLWYSTLPETYFTLSSIYVESKVQKIFAQKILKASIDHVTKKFATVKMKCLNPDKKKKKKMPRGIKVK